MSAVIDAQLVKSLREKTNAGLMECKRALGETNGDLEAAVDLLRKKGAASAAKKADREAKDGTIAQIILPGAKVGVLVWVSSLRSTVCKRFDRHPSPFVVSLSNHLVDEPPALLQLTQFLTGSIRVRLSRSRPQIPPA